MARTSAEAMSKCMSVCRKEGRLRGLLCLQVKKDSLFIAEAVSRTIKILFYFIKNILGSMHGYLSGRAHILKSKRKM